jgi:hypothetical protein
VVGGDLGLVWGNDGRLCMEWSLCAVIGGAESAVGGRISRGTSPGWDGDVAEGGTKRRDRVVGVDIAETVTA